MIHRISLLVVVALAHSAICNSAFADPDNSVVRVVFDTKSSTSTIEASGRTRVDFVAAVLRAVDNCKYPADGVTVGPWLRFPQDEKKRKAQEGTPQLTVLTGDSIEDGASAAYIAITPKFPFTIVNAIATELPSCGFTDIRLISHDEISAVMIGLECIP